MDRKAEKHGRSGTMDGKMQGGAENSQHDNDVHKNRLDFAE